MTTRGGSPFSEAERALPSPASGLPRRTIPRMLLCTYTVPVRVAFDVVVRVEDTCMLAEPYADQHSVTIKEAAARLGITEQAVRQRIRRKTLPAHKIDGKVYVVLSAEQDGASHGSEAVHNDGSAGVASAVRNAYSELVTQLRSENELLREQLTVKDEQLRANQVIISQLAERTRALPVPQSQESAEPSAHAADTAQPWWKRLFGLR